MRTSDLYIYISVELLLYDVTYRNIFTIKHLVATGNKPPGICGAWHKLNKTSIFFLTAIETNIFLYIKKI